MPGETSGAAPPVLSADGAGGKDFVRKACPLELEQVLETYRRESPRLLGEGHEDDHSPIYRDRMDSLRVRRVLAYYTTVSEGRVKPRAERLAP